MHVHTYGIHERGDGCGCQVTHMASVTPTDLGMCMTLCMCHECLIAIKPPQLVLKLNLGS